MTATLLAAEKAPERSRSPTSAWLALFLALPLALPILTIVFVATTADVSAWPALISSVLPIMAWETVKLCLGTALVTLAVGTGLAWLVTMYQFPGRNLLQWSSILPLAMPGYITSFVYVDTFAYSGSAQAALRQAFGWTSKSDYFFPEIRSVGGAIFVLSTVFYPYVYMTARAAFLRQSMNQVDVARTLGRSPWRAFFEITLPQARPALAVGVSLVVMECLNDIGAVGFFGVNTLTFGIYSLWLGQGDFGAAAQLSLVLLIAVIMLVLFEQMMRQRDHLSRAARSTTPLVRQRITGWKAPLATFLGFLPVTFGFLLPVALLLEYSRNHWELALSADFLSATGKSVLLASLACIGTIALALVFGYANRRNKIRWLQMVTKLSGFGYAVPGTILAIGLLVPFGFLDRQINAVTESLFSYRPGLIISGSLLALVFAYVTRFLIVASGAVETGLLKISPHLEEVAQTLGRNPLRAFRDIHVPLLRPSLVAAALLVFVDAMKELPATLLLRPFNFETLATYVFSLASLGQLEDSAVPALAIVAVGLLPVAILSKAVRDAARS
ncbi:MAG: iron ABC transporter permease [Proteobacteria bacterium]|nr:iron ABC transporter permease [Pseudomonadota bacterium]